MTITTTRPATTHDPGEVHDTDVDVALDNPTPVVAPNPHRVPTIITGLGLIAAALGSPYGIHTHPEHVDLVAGAVMAGIGVFLFNLVRFDLYENRPPNGAFKP